MAFPIRKTASDPRKKLFALGRLKAGDLNQTEQAFEKLLKTLEYTGEILWYKFEGVKLRLADKTFLTIDFAVLTKDNQLEMIDVKGAKAIVQDDSLAKIKIAASMYPFTFKIAYPKRKKDGGGWLIEEY